MKKKKLTPSCGASWHGSWHRNTIEPNRKLYDFELVWFSRGTGKIFAGEEIYPFAPGCIIIIPPEIVHCTVADTAVERWCIHFDWYGDCPCHNDPQEMGSFFVFTESGSKVYDAALAAEVPELPGITFPHFCRSVPLGVYDNIRSFFLCSRENGAKEDLLQRGLLMLILSQLLSVEGNRSSGASPLPGAKSQIDSNFSDPRLSAGKVARHCGISTNHLNRLFKESLGSTTTDYIRNRRLTHADELLSQSLLTVKQISFACGFNDFNYFCRLFKQEKGISPGALRKKMRS